MIKISKSERDSLAFFVGFEKLMDIRRERGITLEKMAQMLSEMAVVDKGYVAVSEDELRAVEQDPLHGMSMATIMYARFLGGKATAVAMDVGSELRERIIEMKTENRTRSANDDLEALMAMDSNQVIVTSVSVVYVMPDGSKKRVFAPLSRTDPEWEQVRSTMDVLIRRYIDALLTGAIATKRAAKKGLPKTPSTNV